MIEIQKDSLRFAFPAIAAEIDSLSEAYMADLMPALLAEDHEKVVADVLRAKDALDSPDDYKSKVRSEVARFSHDDIAKELKKHLANILPCRAGSIDISFQRTLRIPDDGKTYDLPPELGRFPLRHLEDYASRVQAKWLKRGGAIMPMYQAEALWLNFSDDYPFAIKIAAGKINAVSGEAWTEGLKRSPQDYVVTPLQPWLDGFAVEKGMIRQFVAMPLGAGYSVEEQLSGKAEFGGLQIQAYPMKAKYYFESVLQTMLPKRLADILADLIAPWYGGSEICCFMDSCEMDSAGMGLGAGGCMRQQIYEDPHPAEAWDLDPSSRCFVHLCDALMWREITGENPPQTPVTAREYEQAGLPWFEHYRDDVAVLDGSKTLAGIKSVNTISLDKGEPGLSSNDTLDVPAVIDCSPKPKVLKE